MDVVEIAPLSHDRVLVQAHFEAQGQGSGAPVVLDSFAVYVMRGEMIARIEN